jgi:ABC-type transport system substrate-binding protein
MPIGAYFGLVAGPRDKIGGVYATLGCDSPDPNWYLGIVLGSKNARAGAFNIANYTKPAADALIAAGLQEANSAKRMATYGKLLRLLAVDLPYVPISVAPAVAGLASKFAWPNYFAFAVSSRPWALDIKPK